MKLLDIEHLAARCAKRLVGACKRITYMYGLYMQPSGRRPTETRDGIIYRTFVGQQLRQGRSVVPSIGSEKPHSRLCQHVNLVLVLSWYSNGPHGES